MLLHFIYHNILTSGRWLNTSVFFCFRVVNNMRRINNITFNARLRVRQVQGVDMGRLLRHGLPRHATTIHTSLTYSRPVQVKMVKHSLSSMLVRCGRENFN